MKTNTSTLSNGIRVVTRQMPSVASVTMGVWIDVGARYEPAHLGGISHFLEHMVFKGTIRRTARQIAEEIESVGGDLNAYTSHENTAFHARVLKENVELAMDLIADILKNPSFPVAEFEHERTVILQEIASSYDNPDSIIGDYLQETAFPHQAIGRSVLGTVATVQSLKHQDLRHYMGLHYVPSAMILAAAGNIEHEMIVNLAERYLTFSSVEHHELYQVADYRGGSFHQKRDLEQTHLMIGFPGVAHKDPSCIPLLVLSTILGGGMSSRLFQEVREKLGLVYSIYSFHWAHRDSGLLNIYAATGHDQVAQLLPVVCNILKTLGSTLTDAEIQRAKTQMKAGLLMSLESTFAQCEQIAQHQLIYGRLLTYEEMIERIEQVDRVALEYIAESTFTQNPTFVTVGSPSDVNSLNLQKWL